VRARIKDGAGNLLFASKQNYPVITQGNPTSDVSILVEPASEAQGPALQAPAASAPGTGSVTGVVTHTVQMALPGDAVVFVQLTDVSQVDAPAQTIGDQTINNPGQAPIPFNLAYDPSVVDPGRTYAVQARITDGTGTVFMQTTTQYPVITQGNPASGVHVVVEPVSGADQPPADQPSVVASVTGTLTYREKVALPSTAIAYVRLFDVTLGNVPTALIGEQTIVNPGQVPIPFDVKYDSGRIDQNHVYAIKASIEDGSGNMLFVTTRNYLVITQGQPTTGVEVILERIYKGMGLCIPARVPCLNGD
jgi:putative lipoprotein